MTDDAQGTTFADFLSDLSVAVVVALRTRDEAIIEELTGHLVELVEAANASDEPELAAYFGVLHGLLHGHDVTTAAENLVGPYRTGYDRIVQELAETADADYTDMTLSEWLARLTTLVAATVKGGSEKDRAELEQALLEMSDGMRAEETGFHDFMAALRGILRGEDTRELALRLEPPYREAYHSLLQLLADDDTSDFAVQAILDRVQHNTVVALQQGNRELRQAVADTLADLEQQLPEDDAATVHFRALMIGARALLLGQEPPAATNTLPEPFSDAWHAMLAASQK